MQVFYGPAYVGAGHVFDTTRKSQWVAESLTADPIAGVQVCAPEPVTETMLAQVHDARYIEAMRTGVPRDLAESQGFRWDSGIWDAAIASTGGVLAAVRAALTDGVAGSLSSGLHHALPKEGRGFCTFNGLALGALHALDRGARRVLILDVDAHCGGGTYVCIRGNSAITHFDLAVHPYDRYLARTPHRLVLVDRADRYLGELRRLLASVEHDPFDCCVYNAGMDPFEGCGEGGLPGITADILAERERLVFQWCTERHVPIAFVLAGGYTGSTCTLEQLIALHRSTITAAVSAGRRWLLHRG